MKTCVFDIETFTLHADTGILLCAGWKEYGRDEEVKMIRADDFKTWRKNKSNVGPVISALVEELRDFDIFVAHNGMFFDRQMIISWALKYNQPLSMRFAKFIDPVHLARKHLRLSRNNLGAVLDFLDIEEDKTPIKWESWKRAAYDSDRQHMDYIVEHCQRDILVLEKAYAKMRKLVKDINERGSSF